jgi:hypothetical protein
LSTASCIDTDTLFRLLCVGQHDPGADPVGARAALGQRQRWIKRRDNNAPARGAE